MAFPAISTGIYGYPLAAATAIAVRTIREHGEPLREIIFACFNHDALNAYAAEGVSPGRA